MAPRSRRALAAILNYTGDRANWGCQATSRGLLASLRRSLGDPTAEFELVPLLGRTPEYFEVEHCWGERLREALDRPRLGIGGARLLLSVVVRLYGWRTLRRVLGCRHIVFQAEGTMAGTDLMKGVGLLALPVLLARVFRRRVVSLNQTIFSADRRFDRIVERAYRSFDVIALREMASYRFAHELGLARAVLIPDAAFLVDPAPGDPRCSIDPRPGGEWFCVSGSSVIEFVPLDAVIEAIRHAMARHSLVPVFLVSSRQDRVLLDRARAEFGEVAVVTPEASPEDVSAVLAGARFLLSGRYHMNILAATAGTPFISLPSNTFKNDGLVELLGGDLPVRAPTDVLSLCSDIDRVVAEFDDRRLAMLAARDRVRAILAAGEAWLAQRFRTRGATVPDEGHPCRPARSGSTSVDPEVLGTYRSRQISMDGARRFIDPSSFDPRLERKC